MNRKEPATGSRPILASRRSMLKSATSAVAIGAMPMLGTSLRAHAHATPQAASSSRLEELATAAFIYGYPFVYDLSEVVSQTTDPRIRTGRPVNVFGHAASLSVPEEKFVSVNNDTLYSIVHCDVSDEPLVLHLPDTNDRYYVMQFIDAWTNNFAYVGRRTTGTSEASYLLAGPGWSGDAPDDVTVITAPTNVFTIVGRYAVEGADDIPAVEALQAETWLSPLSRYPEPPDNSGRQLGDRDLAPFDTRVDDTLAFWEKFRAWMALYPPPTAEEALVHTFAPLGLLDPESPYVDPDPALAEVLVNSAKAGQQIIEDVLTKGSTLVNGWTVGTHAFDYNVHNLGPGTIDAPEWRIDDRPRAFLTRAASARAGLWGNHGYEAAYFTAYVDGDGEALSGDAHYVMQFDSPPPVAAFWSITMYDDQHFYLVDNPIDRYSIGDRTPGLQLNADGSLDVYIQRDSPGADKEANWLPTPEGGFRPVLRAYQPGEAILDGSYLVPPIQRVDGD